ncbi:unnamed protein product [Chironomus riparius]|uniref:Uncharacterized protein n=1 Tax=Chironomus riparius TaxID=315576 RepID=A0A9N9S085_9DIPT|nr:unnamed protein product [Chironomus riparius]
MFENDVDVLNLMVYTLFFTVILLILILCYKDEGSGSESEFNQFDLQIIPDHHVRLNVPINPPPLYESLTPPPNYEDIFNNRHPLDIMQQ